MPKSLQTDTPQQAHQPVAVFSQRLKDITASLEAHQAIIVSQPADVTYLTGIPCLVPEERDAFCLITNQTSYLWHSAFTSVPEPAKTVFETAVGCSGERLKSNISMTLQSLKITDIYIDQNDLRAHEYLLFLHVLETNKTARLVPWDRIAIQKARQCKDLNEIHSLDTANTITQEVVNQVLKNVQPGQTELEVKAMIDSACIQAGASGMAFPTIVAFGANTARPHHQPTATPLQSETAVLIDCGAQVEGYCADQTRTVWFGKNPDPLFTKIQEIVLDAYQQAVEQLEAGVAIKIIDETARNHITKSGYGNQFIHTTGHGVGLQIHESPSLNSYNNELLEVGMAITVEPGIYLPEQFGYRHENSLLITATGSRILGKLSD